MPCPRCAGLVITEYLVNPVGGSPGGFPCRRCLNCGAVEDDVISANHVAPRVPRKFGSARLHRAIPIPLQSIRT